MGLPQFTTGQLVTAAHLNAIVIRQVVRAVKTDTFSTTATAWGTAITGLAVAVTPTAAASKIRVRGHITVGASAVAIGCAVRVMRDGTTAVAVGDAAGSRLQATSAAVLEGTVRREVVAFEVEDEPGDTSEHTYTVEIRTSSGTVFVNRSGQDNDSAAVFDARTVSSLWVEELAG